jgi:hypothetical protein
MIRRLMLGALFAIAGCAEAPPPAQQVAAQPPIAAPPAPAQPVSGTPALPRRQARAGEVDPDAPTPRAKHCRLTAHDPQNIGMGVVSAITASNEGGWCRWNLFGPDGGVQDLVLDDAPLHATVMIHKLKTLVALYIKPEPGYVGEERVRFRIKPSFSPYEVSAKLGP